MINGHDLIDYLRHKKRFFERHGQSLRVYDEIIAYVLQMINASEVDDTVFDMEEIHNNCTVQNLSNSVTGDVSVGWARNE